MQAREEKIKKITELFENKALDEALGLIQELRADKVRLSSRQKADMLYIEGSIYMEKGACERAKKSFNVLLKEGLGNDARNNQVLALHKLGELACMTKNYNQGLIEYRKALRILNSNMKNYNEGLVANYRGQGQCLLEAGLEADANIYFTLAETYQKAVEEKSKKGDVV